MILTIAICVDFIPNVDGLSTSLTEQLINLVLML
jgi:hypothetical protein